MKLLTSIRATLLSLSIGTFPSLPVFAASQGEHGATSTGVVNIYVGIGDAVRISNLQDISGNYDGVNDFTGSSPACVYRNGTGKYNLTATGSGVNGSFEVTDGANSLPFAVSYNDGNGDQLFVPGVQLAGLDGADVLSPTCANTGDNGEITVVINSADLASAPGSAYSGSVTLLLAPE